MVIARPITGKHRKIKDRISIVLFAIFLIMPFIRIGGKPLILLDIPARKFYIFGLVIWPQEMYFLHLIALFMGFSLFFWTALAGRLWCGYACPQTLFTEVYDRVGRLLIKDRYGKPSMTKKDWAIVYFAWLILSVFFNFVFLSYFKPFEETFRQIVNLDFFIPTTYFPHNWVIYMFLGTSAAMFNMAYFRENLCRLLCPYGRFQVALLDRHSPIVTYDRKRGEPRKLPHQKVGQHEGDCIDCKLCNLVCPTGIDIRDGLQVGCLHCGLCVDACTTVMSKFKKETLISYKTIEQEENPQSRVKYFRVRTVVYGSILLVILSAFLYLLVTRVPIYANVLRDKDISNLYIPGIGWRNGYEIHIGNLSFDPLDAEISVESKYPFRMVNEVKEHYVKPEGYEKIRLILEYGEENQKPVANSVPLTFIIKDKNKPEHVRKIKSYFTFPMQ